jgi:hypothetical protein
MPMRGRSLWDRIPAGTRLDLVPILTTGFLAQAGSLTAALIVRLKDGIPFDQVPNPVPVNDLTAVFLFLNFTVVFWFGYRTLRNAVVKGADVSLDAKVVGLAAAFITALELYSHALKTGRPELLSYGLLVLFYVFFVPFFLVRPLTPPATEGDNTKETARQALAGAELVLHALAPCAAATIVCSLYFSLLNDGVAVAGHTVVPAFVRDFLGVSGRTESWGFSPGILGVGWLPALLVTSRAKIFGGDPGFYGLDRSAKLWLLAGALIINVAIALAMIRGANLVPANPPPPAWALVAIRAGLAALLTAVFLLSYFAGVTLSRLALPRPIATLFTAAAFGIAGAVAGLALLWIREQFGSFTPPMLHLVWMHGGGFVLAYAAGRGALALLRRRLPDITPDPGNIQGAII